MKTCCVTGHRPKGFLWKYGNKNCPKHFLYIQRLKEEITSLTEKGFTHFISGGAIGVDLDFAEIVLTLRKKLCITLEIAVPCDNQDLKWTNIDKKRYARVIKKADIITYVGKQYTSWCMQKRNEYMVNNSDVVIAVWNGEMNGGTYNTIKYATKLKKQINFIYLKQIKDII